MICNLTRVSPSSSSPKAPLSRPNAISWVSLSDHYFVMLPGTYDKLLKYMLTWFPISIFRSKAVLSYQIFLTISGPTMALSLCTTYSLSYEALMSLLLSIRCAVVPDTGSRWPLFAAVTASFTVRTSVTWSIDTILCILFILTVAVCFLTLCTWEFHSFFWTSIPKQLFVTIFILPFGSGADCRYIPCLQLWIQERVLHNC